MLKYVKNEKMQRICVIAVTLIFITAVISIFIDQIGKYGIISNNVGHISPKYKAGNKLTFYIATDTHYLAKSLRDNGQAFQKFVNEGDGKQLNYISEILEAFAHDMKESKPEILIISGDLTNNGEAESHKEMAQRLKEIESYGTSVYIIPGNHDISNPWARRFKGEQQYLAETVSPKKFINIYKDFGYNEAVMRDETTLSYLAAPSEEVWLLMLDTSQYSNNKVFGFPQTDGEISLNTLEWIKKCIDLAKKNNAELIPVMHHNLLNHSEVIIDGYTLNNNQDVLTLFEQSNIKLSLSGHIHIQDISSHNGFYDIATSSLAVYPQQYGILEYTPASKTFAYKTTSVNVEGWAKAVGSQDSNLIGFRKFSEAFFGDLALKMARRNLERYQQYSKEELQQMAEAMKRLNLRYFAGDESSNVMDILKSEGYQLWETAPNGFMKSYIKSIAEDEDTEDNLLNIQLR